jgi:uncharacterized membrane protein
VQSDEYKRAKINSASNYGLIGSILVILGFIPRIGSALAIIGFILILISLYELSQIYNNNLIFDNALKALIASIVGFIIVAFVSVSALFTALSHGFTAALILAMVAFIIFYLIILVYGYFIRQAYAQLSTVTGIQRFESVGKFYWLGAVLLIVFVGVVLILIADIYAILAFHELNMKTSISMQPAQQGSISQPSQP